MKELYGVQNDAYWDQGVRDKDIKTEAYRKSLEYSGRTAAAGELPGFIDYRKIVEDKAHWSIFKPVFDIPSRA